MFRVENERDFKNCVVVSIRVCLQIWTIVRLFLDLAAIGYLGYCLLILIVLGYAGDFFKLPISYLMIIILVMLIVNVGFYLIMLSALFKQSYSTLRVMYYYEIYAITALMVMIPVTFYVLYASELLFESVTKCVCLGITGILVVLVEVLILLGVKSQLIEIRNTNQPESIRLQNEKNYY